jgi:hypothetical protein
MGTGASFPGGKSSRSVKLTTHLQLVQRSRKCGSIHPLPILILIPKFGYERFKLKNTKNFRTLYYTQNLQHTRYV